MTDTRPAWFVGPMLRKVRRLSASISADPADACWARVENGRKAASTATKMNVSVFLMRRRISQLTGLRSYYAPRPAWLTRRTTSPQLRNTSHDKVDDLAGDRRPDAA